MYQAQSKGFGCDDCKYLTDKRCKLWQVKVTDPHDSHCESGQPKSCKQCGTTFKPAESYQVICDSCLKERFGDF